MGVKFEFLVDDVGKGDHEVIVKGACNLGVFEVGDTFSYAYKHRLIKQDNGGYQVDKVYDQREIQLTVKKISAYGYSIDEVYEGLTAEVTFSCKDETLIEKNDLLSNVE